MSDAAIDALIDQIRALSVTPIALELQWSLEEDDWDHTLWVLELHAIHAQSGPDHSEYSTLRAHTFPGDTLDERREALRIAHAIAERMQLALHAPPIEARGGQRGSNFLRTTPPTRLAGYEVEWEVVWWTPDGRRHEAAGHELIDGGSGDEARRELRLRLLRWPYRPMELRIDRSTRTHYSTTLPGEPDRSTLRLAARADLRASAIARRFPEASPLALMQGFSQAFRKEIDQFGDIARWRAGEISDAALDAALAPVIERRRPIWERPLLMLERRRAGESIAAFVRAEYGGAGSRLPLINDLRDAFGLGLSDAASFMDRACENRGDDAALDLLLPV